MSSDPNTALANSPAGYLPRDLYKMTKHAEALAEACRHVTDRLDQIIASSSLRIDWKSCGALRELKNARQALADWKARAQP